MKTGKIWGITELLHHDPGIEIHRLNIIPGYHCSWHRHLHKINAFFVFSGLLFIERKKDYGLIDRTEMRAGEFTLVPAGELHRFMTEGEPCQAIEIYYPMPLGNDIVREDNGGPNEPQDMASRLARDAAAETDGRSKARPLRSRESKLSPVQRARLRPAG